MQVHVLSLASGTVSSVVVLQLKFCVHLCFPLNPVCCVHLTNLDVMPLQYLMNSTIYEAPHYAVFFIYLSPSSVNSDIPFNTSWTFVLSLQIWELVVPGKTLAPLHFKGYVNLHVPPFLNHSDRQPTAWSNITYFMISPISEMCTLSSGKQIDLLVV
jgi:hypothetical protein